MAARLLRRRLDPAEVRRLRLAVAALEGVVMSTAERDPAAYDDPDLPALLAATLRAAWGEGKSLTPAGGPSPA